MEEEATYTYQLIVRFLSGAELKSDLLTVTVLPVIQETVLRQNYPNPFNPETWLPYELAKNADVTIEIYDGRGRLVRRLYRFRLVISHPNPRDPKAVRWLGGWVVGWLVKVS